MLPPACDEFLFYERLEGIEAAPASGRGRAHRAVVRAASPVPEPVDEPVESPSFEDADLGALVTRTLAGLERSIDGPVQSVDS